MRLSESLKKPSGAKKNPALNSYLKQACRKTRLFINKNDLRLTSPELFTPLQPPAVIRSPLHWEANKADLYELLIAFDSLGIITEDGVKAPFTHLVREFSRAVNIPFDPECHNERKRILNRSTRKTVFIDRLKRDGFKIDEKFSY